ncbi:MAG TPA: lipid-binding SYLF domain-containing protein [Terracidiphilus sp.]
MKKLLAMLLIAGCGSALSIHAAAQDHERLNDRLDSARNVIDAIMSTPDHAVPEGIARHARCIAVVPGVLKGAFIVGAEYGQGVVTCRTGHGWSGPVFIRLAGGSFGFQIGGKGTDLVLVATNDRGFQDLLHDKFKIGGDASAAAGPVGRDAQASTDISLRAELLTWSRSHGIFAGIDLSGVTVSKNSDDTDELYGGHHGLEHILMGDVPPPPQAEGFLHAIREYFGDARMH